MKILIPFLLILFSFNLISSGQSENIKISKEPGIDELVNKHKYFNEVQRTIPGYRIQIFSGSGNYSKGNALSERSRFMGRYPSVKAYIIFNTPYYIVKTGDFRTRLEAEAFRQLIIEDYPESYVVKDDIELSGEE
jgi:hypothetical protein